MKMIGTELLDDRRADPHAVRNELRDIARLNTLFGGTKAVLDALEAFFRDSCNVQPATCDVPWTLLDVGTGSGDIALAAVAAARRHGITLTAIGLEVIPAAARLTRANGVEVVLGDGGALPFGAKSIDIVSGSQLLHHLPRAVAVRWIGTKDIPRAIRHRAVGNLQQHGQANRLVVPGIGHRVEDEVAQIGRSLQALLPQPLQRLALLLQTSGRLQ